MSRYDPLDIANARIKELEDINAFHQECNGELRATITKLENEVRDCEQSLDESLHGVYRQ